MKTSALQRKKNSCSYEPLPTRLPYAQAIEDLQHCLSGGYSKVKETYLVYHLIAIPCALILGCAVWFGNRIMPKVK